MNIMVGYDRSNVAKEAVALAKKHAKAFDGKLYLLTSLAQSPELQLEDIQKAEHELERLRISFKSTSGSTTSPFPMRHFFPL